MHTKIRVMFISLFVIALAACSGGDDDNYTSVYDVIEGSDVHATLKIAVDTAELDSVLDDSSGEFTVFAPTDSAFEALGEDTINALLADTDTLSNILLYHVLGYEASASDLVGSSDTSITMLNDLIVAKGFEGSDLYLNYALVIQTDLSADNGVVHVIDTVLVPLDLTPSDSNIVETAVADGRFTTLVTALQAAELVDTLSDETTSFTVFAPTDDAFALLPDGTLETLLADTDALSAILLQHVVAGAAVDSVSALTLDGTMVETAGGAMIDIDVDFSTEMLMVGGANVIISDIVTNNGIIHVIDAVITDAI